MTRPAPRISRRGRFALSLLTLLLSGCTLGPSPAGGGEAQAQQSLVTACRQRADEAYNVTHRDQIYASESQVNTPFSANYQPGIPSRGLSDLFARDQMVDDCVRNTGAEGSRTPSGTEPGTAPAAPPVPRP